VIRATALQSYTLLFSLLLRAAAEQLNERELTALHETAIEILAQQVAERRVREAA
jgi:hypothetical protein